jgi:hypothetical protein
VNGPDVTPGGPGDAKISAKARTQLRQTTQDLRSCPYDANALPTRGLELTSSGGWFLLVQRNARLQGSSHWCCTLFHFHGPGEETAEACQSV